MARILRGDILWANLESTTGHEQAGLRPVLVLRQDVFNRHSCTVIAVALGSKEPKAGYPLTLELTRTALPKRSWVRISQIRTLSTNRLGNKLGQAHPEELRLVLDGLREILGG